MSIYKKDKTDKQDLLKTLKAKENEISKLTKYFVLK